MIQVGDVKHQDAISLFILTEEKDLVILSKKHGLFIFVIVVDRAFKHVHLRQGSATLEQAVLVLARERDQSQVLFTRVLRRAGSWFYSCIVGNRLLARVE